MDAMSSPAKLKSNFSGLLARVRNDFPSVAFEPSDMFRWSAEAGTVYYDASSQDPMWSLLHEIGHMQHGHNVYNSDNALIRMEVEAWESARELGAGYGLIIDDGHIQDCLDSYRHWQHKRSTCPECTQTGVEKQNGTYRCINCHNTWNVSTSRFCRVYRRSALA
jgi:hypothetical protein